LDKYFLLYSHYIFWNVMVLLLEYVFSVLFPPLIVILLIMMGNLSMYVLYVSNHSKVSKNTKWHEPMESLIQICTLNALDKSVS